MRRKDPPWRNPNPFLCPLPAQLGTSVGNLNLELHADLVPRACDNFVGLCERGYYDGVAFHRLVPGFCIQGGDPTGTGRGGESLWGKPFGDEFHPKLRHSERGVLSMANSGPKTNASQFFILFGGQRHLDDKHTVFGRCAGRGSPPPAPYAASP